MINCIICEDDISLGNILKTIIKDYYKKNNLNGKIKLISDSYDDVLSYAKCSSTGTYVYFMDIFLNEQFNGLTLAKEIRKYDFNCYIIFITSHLEFPLKVFQYKLKALDYIFKGDGNLKERVFECLDIIKKESIKSQLEKQNKKSLLIKSKSHQYIIPFQDIIYFETDTQSRKIVLHTLENKIEFYDTLSNLVKKLDNTFYRCHRSYIINLNYIKKISTERNNMHVLMSNGDICLLSQKYLRGLMGCVDNNL